jgi:integrative and conjugative element protein (TIGR02256 family)
MQIKFNESSVGVTIIFSPEVIKHFSLHRQIERIYEIGGQLFACFLPTGEVLIEKITGPREADTKLLNFFKPNKRLEQQEIDSLFKEGYHYVGDWHTHPEKLPSPSSEDINNIGNIFRKSRHSLNHFILVIVGQEEAPNGLYVGIHNGITIKSCRLIPSSPRYSKSACATSFECII